MNTSRRSFLGKTSLSCAAVCLGGCSGELLTPRVLKPRTYSETVSNLYISEESKLLAVVGKDYHYIFSETEAITKLFKSGFYQYVWASFGTMAVDKNQGITANYTLHVKNRTPENFIKEAVAFGFTETTTGINQSAAYYNGSLRGTRYQAGAFVLPATEQKLNRTYEITIETPRNYAKVALLTPITVAADGALIIAAGAIFVPFSLFCGAAQKHCF
jgi:hypothetical protein